MVHHATLAGSAATATEPNRLAIALTAALSYAAGQITPAPTTPPNMTHRHHHDPRPPCSAVELIGLGIDRGLPLGATGLRAAATWTPPPAGDEPSPSHSGYLKHSANPPDPRHFPAPNTHSARARECAA